jgi:aminodeoxyfutalosine synthase
MNFPGLRKSRLQKICAIYAVSRIYLDNIPHIKAYWPMIGKQMAALSLSFGVDDLDGTINDSTKIYSMAGAEDMNPSCTSEELKELIKKAGRIPSNGIHFIMLLYRIG